MNNVVIDGLDIAVTQKITGFKIANPRLLNSSDEGITWGGSVTLMSGDTNLGNRQVRKAIQDNTSMTWEELEVASQATYTKSYTELTVVESQTVQGTVLATNMIASLNEAGTGISVDDVSALVAAVVASLT